MHNDMNEIIKMYESGRTIDDICANFEIKRNILKPLISNYYKSNSAKTNRIKNIAREDLYNQYFKEGMKIKQLAEMYDVSNTTISTLIENYCKENNIQDYHLKYTPSNTSIDIKTISNEYIYKEKNIYELAMEYNVSEHFIKESIKEYLKDNNIENPYSKNKKNVPVDEIMEQLKDGKTLTEVSKNYNVSVTTICKRLRENYTKKELTMINNRKYYDLSNKSNEIVNMYLEGITIKEISENYNVAAYVIKNIINEVYTSKGKPVPVIANEKVVENFVKTKHLSRDDVMEYAKNSNRVIPKKYLDRIFQEEKPIELDKIKEFIIHKCVSNEVNLNFDAATILKSKEYGNEYIATALLQELQSNIYTTEEEIKNISNEKIVYAIKVLNSFNGNKSTYTKNLKKCDLARIVKLAKYYEKINKEKFEKESINIKDYKSIIKLAEGTKFSEDFNEDIIESNER